MKLIFCPDCYDVVKLYYEDRSCLCGKVHGHYRQDGQHAVVSPADAVVLGIDNGNMEKQVRRYRAKLPKGSIPIEAFLIGEASTVERKDDERGVT